MKKAIEIVLSTKNTGKVREILQALGDLDFHFTSLLEYPHLPTIEESGNSYRENALIKASAVSRATGQMALADDSGLEVEELGWEPGIHSARYVTEEAGDELRNKTILKLLKGIPWERRRAVFRCCITMAMPDGQAYFAHGECYGYIAEEARGSTGFGYDPIFYVPEYGQTFAELGPSIKNRISHRAKALKEARKILQMLSKTFAADTTTTIENT